MSDDSLESIRAATYLARLVREVDPVSRVISIGDVDDGFFVLFGRHSRLAGGCTVDLSLVARAIAGDEAAHDAILADFKRCLDSFAA